MNSEINIKDIIRNEICRNLREDFDDDMDNIPIASLGIDSLDFFEILMHLEDEHNIVIPIDDLDDTVTINSIISTL